MHLLYNDNGLKNCYRQLGQIIHQPLAIGVVDQPHNVCPQSRIICLHYKGTVTKNQNFLTILL